MTGSGHFDPCPPPRLNGGCPSASRPPAETYGNRKQAPQAVALCKINRHGYRYPLFGLF